MPESNRNTTVREAILSAGVSLLRGYGITALTQPKVATAARVKQSHLTYYFPKRADLLLGVAEYAIDNILHEVEAGLTESASASALVDIISAAVIKGVPPRVMLGLIVAADAAPEIRPALQKLIRRVRDQIQMLLAKASMTADDRTALIFHAVVVGLAVMHDAQRTERSAQEVKTGLDLFVELIGA
ncbi:TetR/AcrR family transcriptional regulator [Methylomonas sp. MgM2]